jgi:uncharacterized protein YjbI with pentapeptide repeats
LSEVVVKVHSYIDRIRRSRPSHDEASLQARKLEEERARQEAALREYFEQMGKLLADKNRPLRRSILGDNLSTEARRQTLTMLEGLDPVGKQVLLEFLYGSALIYKQRTIISLNEANLSDADLRALNLNQANLSGAILREADLSGTNLSWARLSEADLSGTNFGGADLSWADLRWANLSRADLSEASLRDAELSGAYLSWAIVTQGQLEQARGNQETRLPSSLEKPATWKD